MDAPFQKRHLSAKVEMSLNHVPKGGTRNEDYDNWRRFGKKRDTDPRSQFPWQYGAAEAAQTQPGDGIFRKAGAMPDRDGSVRQLPPLGQEAAATGAYREADGATVRQALREDE